MSRDPLQIAFIADGAYAPHAAAMIDSVLARNAGEDLRFHLLEGSGARPDDLDVLERWLVGRRVPLTRHVVPETLMQGFPGEHFHRSIWYRTLLPALMPDCPRILYLDADTLALDRLRPLWKTDVSAHLFAAVTNPLYPFMENWPVDRLGLPSARRYLNSGVLLLNLDAMRRENCVAALRAYAAAHPENRYPEQDALSALFHERCRFLHPRWNVQTTLFDLDAAELPFARAEVREARQRPAIAHFIGPFKPDHVLSRHPHGRQYREHRRNTPWPPGKLAGRTPLNLLLRRLPMAWQYRYFVSVARPRL